MNKILKLQIFNIFTHPLFAGSMVMILGNNFVNAVNFVYTLLMGRLLGPSDYGVLSSLLSFVALVGMIPFSLGLVIIKFISSSKSEKQTKVLVNWFHKKILLFSLIVSGLVVITSSITASFLNITNPLLIVLIGISFLFSIPAFYNRSVLQGLLKFKQVVVSVILENSFKLIFSLLIIYLGFALFGAVGIFVASGFFGWLITRKFLKNYLNEFIEKPIGLSKVFFYAIPVLIQSLAATSLYSADVILVKHFFNSHDAGLYASLSTLGRIVFFGASPISAVMFPIISKRQSKGENYKKIFFYSVILTLAIATCVLVIYWFFPELAILILFGSDYLEGAYLLFWIGLFMTVYTLCTVFISLHLSLGQTKVVIFPALAAIGQVIGINLYHKSLEEVIIVSMIDVSLLLLCLTVYFCYKQSLKTKFS
jgi:O-antigen/teichoic acid export membrane protein